MDEKTELLNCPFCGCEPILERFEDYAFSIKCTHNYYWNEPDENGVRTAADVAIYADIKGKYNYETNDWEYTEEEINNCEKAAIEAWNKRAERTCHMKLLKHGVNYDVFYFDCCDNEYAENRNDPHASGLSGDVCPYCGARVIEDE